MSGSLGTQETEEKAASGSTVGGATGVVDVELKGASQCGLASPELVGLRDADALMAAAAVTMDTVVVMTAVIGIAVTSISMILMTLC